MTAQGYKTHRSLDQRACLPPRPVAGDTLDALRAAATLKTIAATPKTIRDAPRAPRSRRFRLIPADRPTPPIQRARAAATLASRHAEPRGSAYAPPLGPVAGPSALELRVMPQAS
jgi:hypothetical protein